MGILNSRLDTAKARIDELEQETGKNNENTEQRDKKIIIIKIRLKV